MLRNEAMASFATKQATLGRKIVEKDVNIDVSPFEADRHRVLNCKSFRRLEAKTQAFAPSSGDHFRKRLTHSLEVSSIARRIALSMNLNVALTETIALAHDIGHPPFGHIGEECLNLIMARRNLGFCHNVQGFKGVTKLERHFIDCDGLNLTWETLDGILKHNGPLLFTDDVDKIRMSYVLDYNKGLDQKLDLRFSQHPSIEAQVASIADDIAYIAHDVEDAFRAKLLTLETVAKLPMFDSILHDIKNTHSSADHDLCILEAKHRITSLLTEDLIKNTSQNLMLHKIRTDEDVRSMPCSLASFSETVFSNVKTIKAYLMQYVYNFQSNKNMIDWAYDIISTTFDHFMFNPQNMPINPWQKWYFASDSEDERAVVVCDFVSGMTDSFIVEFSKGATLLI